MTVEGDRLEVVLQVSALASVAVAMPHASDRWQLDEVSVDARGSLAIARERDASLWVPLTAGRAHRASHGPARRRRIDSARLPAAAARHRRDARAAGR